MWQTQLSRMLQPIRVPICLSINEQKGVPGATAVEAVSSPQSSRFV